MTHQPKISSDTDAGVFSYKSTDFTAANGVLSANSSSGGSKTWTLVNSQSVTTAVNWVQFINIPTSYKEIYWTWENVTPSAAFASVIAQFSSNNISTVQTVMYHNGRYSGAGATMTLGGGGTSANKRAGFMHIMNFGAVITINGYFGGYQASSPNALHYGQFSAQVLPATPLNSMRFGLSGANMTSGTFYMYGAN